MKFFDGLKRARFLVILFIAGLIATAAAAAVAIKEKEKESTNKALSAQASTQLAALVQERDRLIQALDQVKTTLAQKESELDVVSKQNFQGDLITAQMALKETHKKLNNLVGEKVNLENLNYNLETRLKNTTAELTKTLEELRNTRETLGGIDAQYKTKLAQLAENIKIKDVEFQKILERLKVQETDLAQLRASEKNASEILRKAQYEQTALEKKAGELNRVLADKEKQIASKDEELRKREIELGVTRKDLNAAKSRTSTRRAEEAEKKVFSLEKSKAELEAQIEELRSRSSGIQGEVSGYERKVSLLNQALSEKSAALKKGEFEILSQKETIEVLRRELTDLRSRSSGLSDMQPAISEATLSLEKKIRQLEEDKMRLEEKLRKTSLVRRAEKSQVAPRDSADIFADRNFRILTETLVKREEELSALRQEVESLRSDKKFRESGSGLKEKRLNEMEILVTTLTKQLGDYAASLEKKDMQLKAANAQVNSLMEEVEAQKIASIALRRDLAQTRGKQEKTFQTLTQIMSLNADAVENSGNDEEIFEEGGSSAPASEIETKAAQAQARRRAEELKKQVEVFLDPER